MRIKQVCFSYFFKVDIAEKHLNFWQATDLEILFVDFKSRSRSRMTLKRSTFTEQNKARYHLESWKRFVYFLIIKCNIAVKICTGIYGVTIVGDGPRGKYGIKGLLISLKSSLTCCTLALSFSWILTRILTSSSFAAVSSASAFLNSKVVTELCEKVRGRVSSGLNFYANYGKTKTTGIV